MKRIHLLAIGSLGVAVVLAVACNSDRPQSDVTVTAPDTREPATSRSSERTVTDADREDAKRKFHRNNRDDWVGVAHNAAMDHLHEKAATILKGPHVCDKIVDLMMEEGRSVSSAHKTQALSRRAVETVMLRSACAGYFNARQGSHVHPASYVQSEEQPLSPAASSLTDQISTATLTTATSGDLALQLNPIVDAAYGLTASGETDIVLAGASVAQSSREYWEVQLIPGNYSADITNAVTQNAACFSLYSDANTAVSQCMGLSEPQAVIPTGFRRSGASESLFHLAQSEACWDQNMNLHEIGHQDFVGAVAGAITGFWTGGPAAVGEAALLGGGGLSAAELAWQIGKTAYCNYKTGGWNRPEPQPT